jgi:hypothetical protein
MFKTLPGQECHRRSYLKLPEHFEIQQRKDGGIGAKGCVEAFDTQFRPFYRSPEPLGIREPNTCRESYLSHEGKGSAESIMRK